MLFYIKVNVGDRGSFQLHDVNDVSEPMYKKTLNREKLKEYMAFRRASAKVRPENRTDKLARY